MLSLGKYFDGIPPLEASEITYIDPMNNKVLITSFGRAFGYKQGLCSLTD